MLLIHLPMNALVLCAITICTFIHVGVCMYAPNIILFYPCTEFLVTNTSCFVIFVIQPSIYSFMLCIKIMLFSTENNFPFKQYNHATLPFKLFVLFVCVWQEEIYNKNIHIFCLAISTNY